MNGIILETYPRIAEVALEGNWEFMGHGYIQGPMHSLESQLEHIKSTVEAIKVGYFWKHILTDFEQKLFNTS